MLSPRAPFPSLPPSPPAPLSLLFLFLFLLLLPPFCALSRAQSLQTLLSNGPVSNRFNIVFFSEGYTADQLGKFSIDATNALNGLLSVLPWSAYSNYLNAFAISVASAENGSDHPAYSLYRATYFNSSYDAASDYLITIPPNGFDTNYSHGQGRVDALLQSLMPNCSLAIILVNDPVPGGSDGFNQTAIVYAGAGFQDILRHEVGHVAANLGDEYTTSNPGFPDTEEPNTTRQTNSALIKWRAWIPATTPIPTPPVSTYDSVVGLFEGAHYHPTGWYRPKLDCTMNHPSFPDFCEVCREALVLAVYRKVRPVDAWTPAATNLVISFPQTQTFTLGLIGNSHQRLAVQWSTNSVPVPGATNSTFNVSPLSVGNGSCLLTALVQDETSLVRTDASNLLSQTLTWQISVAVTELRLDSPVSLPGAFAFRVTGSAPQDFAIESSEDAVSWQRLATNQMNGGQYWFTNSVAPGVASQLFRAVAPP